VDEHLIAAMQHLILPSARTAKGGKPELNRPGNNRRLCRDPVVFGLNSGAAPATRPIELI
jgi:hypothetical protein